MDMKAMILLIGVDDGPLFRVAELHCLIDTVFIHYVPIDHEDTADPAFANSLISGGDRSGSDRTSSIHRALDALTQKLGFGVRARRRLEPLRETTVASCGAGSGFLHAWF